MMFVKATFNDQGLAKNTITRPRDHCVGVQLFIVPLLLL
jgi:hypothetical protein